MHQQRKAASKSQLPFYDRPVHVRHDTSPVQSTGQRHSKKRQSPLNTMLSSLSMETSTSKRQRSSASSVWSKAYPKPPANTETSDDDENWNLLAQASPERLSGVPRITHQDVPSNTRGERQHVLPEQAYLNMPFRSPVSPNHGPQEPKHHRSPVYSAQPILKKPSHESSVILSPGKSSGDAGSPARHIQGAGTACLRPFTRGQTVDHKNNEAEAESRSPPSSCQYGFTYSTYADTGGEPSVTQAPAPKITGLLSLPAIRNASPAEVYTFTLQQLVDVSTRGIILNKVQEGIVSAAQLAAKYVQCPAWSSGACSMGEACPYTHAIIISPCHHFLKGKCNRKESCRFSHGPWLPIVEKFLQSWAHGTDRKVQDGDT